MSRLKINSDFNDYYDILSSESTLTYDRFLKGAPQRASDLKFLRRLGLKTIELKPVSSFFMDDGPIVVYTQPDLHNGKGKKILSLDEANTLYANFTASKYIESDNLEFVSLKISKLLIINVINGNLFPLSLI